MIIWLEDAIFSVLASIVACILGIFIVPFVGDDGALPKWFAWAGQEDATLDGDVYWQSAIAHPVVNRLPRWLRRLLWLWRNPAQVLDARMCAPVAANTLFTVKGNPLVTNSPTMVYGYCFARVGKYWCLYAYYPTFPGMCLRIYMGWKLMDYIHSPSKADNARLAFGLNPFMTRT